MALIGLVGRALPFHCSCEAGLKFVPVTLSVRPGLPAVTVLGEIELIVGACALRREAITSDTITMAVVVLAILRNEAAFIIVISWKTARVLFERSCADRIVSALILLSTENRFVGLNAGLLWEVISMRVFSERSRMPALPLSMALWAQYR